ncbi:rRNA maturation RNase YbeY [Winogradskyella sp.]|nr:rRNA maturation RNase YbeY [Winogradskyella sp.]MDC1503688.1 rRNA maturation RNase YbeY [Winogradskyella sp.]
MISFNYETDFELANPSDFRKWISSVILEEECKIGEINYIFCDDTYLHNLNVNFLDHDTLTDIISFDYSVGKELHGDIYISIERVKDNATDFKRSFHNELSRVMVHGVLHYCGYKDKAKTDAELMRSKEDYYLVKRS